MTVPIGIVLCKLSNQLLHDIVLFSSQSTICIKDIVITSQWILPQTGSVIPIETDWSEGVLPPSIYARPLSQALCMVLSRP